VASPCVDRQLQLFQRVTQRGEDLLAVRTAGLQLPDGLTQVSADPVVQVAQNAPALRDALLLARQLLQPDVAAAQLVLLLRHSGADSGRWYRFLGPRCGRQQAVKWCLPSLLGTCTSQPPRLTEFRYAMTSSGAM
jgi:hypothetical protein